MARWDSIGDMYSVTPLSERQAFAAREAEYEEEPLPRKGTKELTAQVARLQIENRRLKKQLRRAREQARATV